MSDKKNELPLAWYMVALRFSKTKGSTTTDCLIVCAVAATSETTALMEALKSDDCLESIINGFKLINSVAVITTFIDPENPLNN